MENVSADSDSGEDVLCITLGPKSESINVVQEKTSDPNAALLTTMLVDKSKSDFSKIVVLVVMLSLQTSQKTVPYSPAGRYW